MKCAYCHDTGELLQGGPAHLGGARVVECRYCKPSQKETARDILRREKDVPGSYTDDVLDWAKARLPEA